MKTRTTSWSRKRALKIWPQNHVDLEELASSLASSSSSS